MRLSHAATATTLAILVSSITLLHCQSARPIPVQPPAVAATIPPAPLPIVASARPAAPPMTLTASDGSGLKLVQLVGRAVVEDPLAFTELHLGFENPRDRVIEGNFSITLPQGATVSRFAMKLGDTWQEGEVVEKQAARRAYEDFLHRRQDPALLEQGAGNEFTARVFPIPANGVKELIISYSQELVASAPYALPLRGLPEVGQLDVAVTLPGNSSPADELKRADFTPDSDFTLDARFIKRSAGLRSGNLVLARIHPMPESHPDPLTSAMVLVDTSASRALGFDDELRLVAQLVKKVAGTVTVACFDQSVEAVFSGEASAFGENEIAKMRERQAFGASDVEHALGWAQERAKTLGTKRVIVVGDGVATAGETDPSKLAAAAARLKLSGVDRLDAVAVGGIRDDALMHRLVTAGLAHDGVVADGTRDITTIAHKLAEATRSGIDVKVEEASWSYPRKLDGVQAGDEVLVYADVSPKQPVRISIGGGPAAAPDLDAVDRPLLERAWVQAKIASLVARESVEGMKPETQKEIVRLSVAYRVMSPYTALLVLETEADYARFKIDRSALAEILTVDRGRLALLKRASLPDLSRAHAEMAKKEEKRAPEPATAASATGHLFEADPGPPSADARASAMPPPAAAPARPGPMMKRASDDFGAGGLGLSGVGAGGGGSGEGIGLGSIGVVGHGGGAGAESGFGSGHGRMGGAHAQNAPSLRQGAAQISGRIPPEVVQRIVRQNFGRFRLCYENGLRVNPNLQGRVSVRFVIDRSGAVSSAQNGGSDLVDQGVVACVVRGFTNLSFPQPEGGDVTVVYPILFSPGDSTSDARGSEPNLPREPPAPPPEEKPAKADPYTGPFKAVMETIAGGAPKDAIKIASDWHKESPGDVMALVALGEAFEAANDLPKAERSYGSIIDLFSSRADLRRFAGARLERIHSGDALDLALDSFAKAAAERPDHPESHRLLAFALLKKGDFAKAFEAGVAGLKQPYPMDRFPGVDRILREDLGLLAAAWIKSEPKRREEILAKTRGAGGKVEDGPSLRFVLNWETDANDVDFHIYDSKGGHAFYSQPKLASGGELYADVTTGYGPECFTIRGAKEKRSPVYTLQANYYSRGPMGYGMGKLEIIDHDGKGGITFEERPFVAMIDHAFVDLGTVKR